MEFYDIRLSFSRNAADDDTERYFQLCVHDNQANASLKKLPDVWNFCSQACNQDFDRFPRWLWNYDISKTSSDKFILMMQYALTDFHLNCLAPSKAVNDERTPYIENIIPPFKAFPKLFDIFSFTWSVLC